MPVQSSKNGQPSRLTSIQILRGLAASMVVVHHFSLSVENYGSRPSWIVQSGLGWLGRSGVDLFFVISGFIMVYTTTRKSGFSDAVAFLKKRVRRIYPLYWVWTTILLLMWAARLALTSHRFTTGYILGSYALFPVYSHLENAYRPLLSQGWTLSFEMLFYIVFSFTILGGVKRWRFAALGVVFAGLALLGRMFSEGSALRYLFSEPIIIEFLFGVVAAEIVMRVEGRAGLPRWLSPGLVVLGAFGLLASTTYSFTDSYRFLAYGLPSFCVVLGAATWANAPSHGLLIFLGDASYSIYLAQWLMGQPFAKLLKDVAVFRSLSPDLMIVVGSFITIPLVSLTYLVLERPLLNWITPQTRKKKLRSAGEAGSAQPAGAE